MRRFMISLALVAGAAALSAVLGLPAALAATSYKGGVATASASGSGTDENVQVTFTNDTGEDIYDFKIVVPEGSTIGGVDVDDSGSNEGDDFHVDDNGDGDCKDEGENNDTDSSPGTQTRTISSKKGSEIAKGATFTLVITVTHPATITIEIQATHKDADGDPGEGGNLFGMIAPVTPVSPTAVAAIRNDFDIPGISCAGRNDAPSPLLSVSFTPPSGVSIVAARSNESPGSWDPVARRWTFAVPIGSSEVFRVEVDVAPLALGPTTDIEYTANW
jgi:hypothetical protein